MSEVTLIGTQIEFLYSCGLILWDLSVYKMCKFICQILSLKMFFLFFL